MRKCLPVKRTLGEALRQARVNAGLSLREASRATGMSTSQISQLENGLRPDPAFSTVVKLAGGLKMSLDALVAACASSENVRSDLRPPEREYLALLSELELAQRNAEKLAVQLASLLHEKTTVPGGKRAKRKS